jgi:hypothetical protein
MCGTTASRIGWRHRARHPPDDPPACLEGGDALAAGSVEGEMITHFPHPAPGPRQKPVQRGRWLGAPMPHPPGGRRAQTGLNPP